MTTIAAESDNPTLTEAMNGPNTAGFLKTTEIKIETLIDMETLNVVRRESWMKVISSIWAFKVKIYTLTDLSKNSKPINVKEDMNNRKAWIILKCLHQLFSG